MLKNMIMNLSLSFIFVLWLDQIQNNVHCIIFTCSSSLTNSRIIYNYLGKLYLNRKLNLKQRFSNYMIQIWFKSDY